MTIQDVSHLSHDALKGQRSQGYHGGTNLAYVESEADHANVCRAGVSPPVSPAQRITSSAWMRRVGGIVRPSVSAVFRLIIRSNCVGRSTGRSAGLAPRRMRST